LGLQKGKPLATFESGFEQPKYPLYEQPILTGIRCANKNCVVHDPLEGKHASNRFHVIDANVQRLRCFYCETDIEQFVVANKKSKHYEPDPLQLRAAIGKHEREIVIFSNATDAEAAGYSLSKRRRKAANA